MDFKYSRIENCILLDNLKNDVVKKTLAYMVDFKEHDNLVVIPKQHSIEISNADICIAVILFSGFEKEEYEALKTKDNFHIISFDTITKTMVEFENMLIKHIDYLALFFMSLSRTEDANIKDFLHLKNLCQNKTIFQLRKKYILKDVVWNSDLFSLLYKKYNARTNSKKIKNKFLTSMVLEVHSEAFNEVNLKNISSSLIQELVKNRELLTKKQIHYELGESKPLLVGFAVVSGKKRAKKAIELALSSLLFKNLVFTKNNTILLLLSSDSIEINLDEIGEINDYIQEKSGYTADIVMYINEDKNLGEALAITLISSDSEK